MIIIKDVIQFMANMWFWFSIFAGIFIVHCYDSKTETGVFFVESGHIYWAGYIGELDYD